MNADNAITWQGWSGWILSTKQGAKSRGKPNRQAGQDSATMDFGSPDKSSCLVVKGLRALEPLDNALVRVQVLL